MPGRKAPERRPGASPGLALNCDVLPFNTKGFAFPSEMAVGHLDIEPPEALWPETKGQAASLVKVRGHPLYGAGTHGRMLCPSRTGECERADTGPWLGRILPGCCQVFATYDRAPSASCNRDQSRG